MLRRHIARLLILSTLMACGCMNETEWARFWNRDRDKGTQPAPSGRGNETLATRNTIGALVTIDGLRMTHVRGYGLVVDLVDQGGSDGPDQVQDYLIKEMRRQQDISGESVPAKEMLESRDTAMVEVTGLIPAGAKEGDRFDIVMRALGTQTKSLVGGRLFLCNLKQYAETPSGLIGGKTLATASGPVFVSPFTEDGKPARKVDLRTGWVLGGGVVSEPRRIRLVLDDPSYSMAQRIVSRVNSRYMSTDPVAVGQSPSYVDLEIPKKYDARRELFLQRVVHTNMNSSESFLRRHSEELAAKMLKDGEDRDAIGLALEAVGDLCLDDLRPLYRHESADVRFFAGRTGLRLEDRGGMEAVARVAQEPKSEYRLDAIEELGYATDMYAAGEKLRKLLGDEDVSIRIKAYQALRRRPHPAIRSRVLDQDNMILDVVESDGPFLVFVQRSMTPRIALFGRQMKLRPPVIFPGARRDGRRFHTQISDLNGTDQINLVYLNKRTDMTSPPMRVPLNVAELVTYLGGTPVRGPDGDLAGLALPYSEIVDILSWFCESRSIPATFVVEDLRGREDYSKQGSRERPESEL